LKKEGQVTLPPLILDALGARPGDVLDVEVANRVMTARKEPVDDAIHALYGSIDLGMSTDEFIAELRGRE